jgi:long-chain acyl-CoA synthetase
MTHRNLVHALISDIRTLGVSAQDRTVVAGSMCYVTGLVAQFFLFLYIGGVTVIMPRFDAEGLLETLRDERITFFHVAPTTHVLLMSVPGYGSIPDSVIEDKKAHLVLCLFGANKVQEVSHEGNKIILRS